MEIRFCTLVFWASGNAVGIIWGRNSATVQVDEQSWYEPSLRGLCNQNHIKSIYIAGVQGLFGEDGGPSIYLPHHNIGLIPQDVAFCRSKGVKIHLLIENQGHQVLQNDVEGVSTAQKIWQSFIENTPLGYLDGINISIRDTLKGYAGLFKELDRLRRIKRRKLLTSLTVQCNFPDGFCGPVHKGTVLETHPQAIDKILVQMLGSGGACSFQYQDRFYSSLLKWREWTSAHSQSGGIIITPSMRFGSTGDFIHQDDISSFTRWAKLTGFSEFIIGDASYDALDKLPNGETYSQYLAKSL